MNQTALFPSISPRSRFVKLTTAFNATKMNTRARTTRDTQGQVGQRKKELANKLSFASQANSLQKVTFFKLDFNKEDLREFTLFQEVNPELGANDLTAKIPTGIPDIDANNKAEECGQYARHNFSYLRYLEVKHQTKGTDALENAGILPKWRVILVDWLREISQKLNGKFLIFSNLTK